MAEPPAQHRNNVGALRLALALLVILSHAPELLDGDRSRELLTGLTGTMTFGGLAVDGFFLISGYLVTQSWMVGGGGGPYFVRRILRIYPGFLVAYVLSLVLFGPLGGGHLGELGVEGTIAAILRALLLLPPPDLPGYADVATPALNGSLGTIAYEFRCYLLVGFLSVAGLLRRRRLFLVLTGMVLGLALLRFDMDVPVAVEALYGDPLRTVRLTSMFLAGAAFFLWRDRIRLDGRAAALCGVGLALLAPTPLAPLAVATLGAYGLFWIAFGLRSAVLQRINARTDISYGVYLYSWPLTNALILQRPDISPWALAAAVATLALPIGLLSWTAVEKPALRLKALFTAPAPAVTAPA
jgi:peptidoglycan/LPS O-acetylase OafA/YrhL